MKIAGKMTMGDIVQGVGGYLSVNLLDTLLGRCYAVTMNKGRH